MKKIIASFAAFFLIFSAPVLFAQMAVPMTGAIMPSLERIGVVAAAGGQVELTTPGQVGRIAQSGQAIFMGDEVKTDAAGHLQILLLDETVFTIGPNSSIIIDKFVYDPKTQGGEIKASVTKGVFRYVSGKIAAKNPGNVKVKLPTATLGFRGTIVGGSVGANGQGLVGLLGPGDHNDAGARTGSFTVEGSGGGQADVNRTGFGVEVGADGGVSNVFQLSDDQVNGLTQGLGGGQGGGGGAGGGEGGLGGDTNMGALSGENNALTGGNVTFTGGLGGVSDNMNDVSTKGAQDALNANGEAGITNGTTTMEQLIKASGSGHYADSGTYSQGGGSGYTYAQTDIVFGPSGYIGGGNSSVEVFDGIYRDSTNIGDSGIQFTGSGPARFDWNATSPETGGVFKITATLSNSDGVTAQQALIQVSYDPAVCTSGCPALGNGTVSATLSPGALTGGA